MNPMIEVIFSHAAALTQSGRLRNEIFCKDQTVYIANFDNTILLQFKIPLAARFSEETNFNSNDYDSEDFGEENGRIVFVKKNNLFIRKKVCGKTQRSFDDIDNLFSLYPKQEENNLLNLHNSILPMLDENLSHIEISAINQKVLIVQRDIYTGSRIEISENQRGQFFSIHQIKTDFGPIGLRTNDFFAMFSFCENVKFYFSNDNSQYCFLAGELKFGASGKTDMNGVISACVYDELGTIENVKLEEKDIGREKQEDWRSEQEIDTTTDTGKSQSRRTRPEGQETSVTRKRQGFLR